MSKLTVSLLIALALAAGVAGCGGSDSGNVPDNAVAVVGDDEITKAEFDSIMERAKRAYATNKRPFPKPGTADYKALQNQAVQYLVQQSRYAQKADDLDIDVTDKEVDDRVAQIKKQYFQNSEKRYQDHLKTQGLTDDQVRADVRNQLISEEIYAKVTQAVKISDDEIAKYYNEHKKDYRQTASRDVRHILVPTNKKALADDLYQQLQNGGNFAALAKKHSTDPGSKASGGKLTVSRGQTVPEFDKVAFQLSKNEISEPVKTQYGFHIIQALSDIKPPRTTPLKDVKEQIRQQLLQEKRQKAIADWSKDLTEEFEDDTRYQVGYAPPSTTGLTETDR